MPSAFVVGTASTRFQRWPDRSFRDLADAVVRGVIADAGLEDGQQISACTFGNCAMDTWGQSNIRGQVALRPLMAAGVLPERLAIINVEGACATGSVALHQAVQAVRAGADLALAVGVEKVFHADDPKKTFALFQGGADQLHPDEWQGFFAEQGARTGLPFAPHPYRLWFLDVHALQAQAHMRAHGTTVAQLATIASKNHGHSVDNPLAQYQVAMSRDHILADKAVVEPFTRSMCSPVSDGAAAVLVASPAWVARQAAAIRDRAVAVRACALVGGAWRDLEAPAVVWPAAAAALREAGISGADLDLAEVHDSTAYCELVATEALGLCAPGQGGPLAESGATTLGGRVPVNTSGGLESKGHPLAATGLSMVHEVAVQLRGEAGARQVAGATLAAAQNAGGLVGYDEALCGVTVLERVR
jgi:acetyl-CoA acetyltransferase